MNDLDNEYKRGRLKAAKDVVGGLLAGTLPILIDEGMTLGEAAAYLHEAVDMFATHPHMIARAQTAIQNIVSDTLDKPKKPAS